MNPSHSIVLRPLRVGLGADATVAQALEELTPIQALIDQVNAGTATSEQAGNAQAAVTSLTSDLNDLGASTAITPVVSSATAMTTGAAILIGLGAGILLSSIVVLAMDDQSSSGKRVRA